MKNKFLLILIFVLFLCPYDIIAQRKTYYLSPKGNDQAAGTSANPWRSIEKANQTLRPGDTACFLPGEYSGVIRPRNSGAAGALITYRSSKRRQAVLKDKDKNWLVLLNGRQYINIEGFYLDGGGQSWLQAIDTKYITVRDCEMHNAGGRDYSVFQFTNSSQVRLLDNLFSADRFSADMIHFINCKEALIEGNSFTRVGHDPLRIDRSYNITIRSNVFHCEFGRNYEMWASARVLFENNIITRARDGSGSAESGAKNLVDNSIFRFNRVYGNLDNPLVTGSYMYSGATPTGDFRGPFIARDNRVYNNVFTDNPAEAWRLGGINVSAHIFKNNIFYKNGFAAGNVQIVNGKPGGDNQFHNNIFHGSEQGQKVIRHGSDYWTVKEASDRTIKVNGFWSEYMDNIDSDPAFRDPKNRDYRLGASSSAVDAGRHLAMAVGEGRGRELPVTDGMPFYDGFGIEGEEGDLIAVGTGDNIARVERVEFRYFQAAILHLDREVSWKDQMPVSLPWAGSAPDIGAYEYGLTHPKGLIASALPVAANPGLPVQFSMDSQGKQIRSIVWDFGDGSFSGESNPVHRFNEAGHYAVTVRAIFANGMRGVDVLFIQVNKPQAGTSPLAVIDFEDETYNDWGFHFKFNRQRQTGSERIEREDGKGKAMHMFYSKEMQNNVIAELSPGIWSLEKNPLLSFEYRIPQGVPISVYINPYSAAGNPQGFTIGGTENRKALHKDLNLFTLRDDGQWHTVTVDLRKVREAYPQLEYLRRFIFYSNWDTGKGQEFWFDEFKILGDN